MAYKIPASDPRSQALIQALVDDISEEAMKLYTANDDPDLIDFVLDQARDILHYRAREIKFSALQLVLTRNLHSSFTS
jgi:hypothetical protein